MSGDSERNTRALKDAQRRPENRRCADCLDKAPSYCALQYATFICQNCSIVHRELFPSARCKSVSMAVWATDEVKAMRAGGNDAASRRWMAEWRPDACTAVPPPNCDRAQLKSYLEEKYVQARWVALSSSSNGGTAAPGPSSSSSSPSSFSGPAPSRRGASPPLGPRATPAAWALAAPSLAPPLGSYYAAAEAQRAREPTARADAKPAIKISIAKPGASRTGSVPAPRLAAPGARFAVPMPSGSPRPAAAPAAPVDDFFGAEAPVAAPPTADGAFGGSPLPAGGGGGDPFAAAPAQQQKPPQQANPFGGGPDPFAAAPATPPPPANTNPFEAAPFPPAQAAPTKNPFGDEPFGETSNGGAQPPPPPPPPSNNNYNNPFGQGAPDPFAAATMGAVAPPAIFGDFSNAAPPATAPPMMQQQQQQQQQRQPPPPPPAGMMPLAAAPFGAPRGGPPPPAHLPSSSPSKNPFDDDGGGAAAAAPAGGARLAAGDEALWDLGIKLERVRVLAATAQSASVRSKDGRETKVDPGRLTKVDAAPLRLRAGDAALYDLNKKVQRCTVAAVHVDDGDEPYYTVRLMNGTERTSDAFHIFQTVGAKQHADAPASSAQQHASPGRGGYPPPESHDSSSDPFAALSAPTPSASGAPVFYAANAPVLYHVKGAATPERAVVVRVHHEGDPPYYTIKLTQSNTERQTEQTRLQPDPGAASPFGFGSPASYVAPPTHQPPPQYVHYQQPRQQQQPQQPQQPQYPPPPPQQPQYPPQQYQQPQPQFQQQQQQQQQQPPQPFF